MPDTRMTPSELGLPECMPLPKRKDWRIGMIGFGGIARYAHLPAYRSAGWNVAAVADINPEARRSAKDEGIPAVYEDYRDLVADDTIDVIDLCTQPDVREQVVAAAAKAGKHIITEKPLAETMDQCLKMVETAEGVDVKLAVHQNYRWMKMNFFAQKIVSKGLIGRPFFASIEIFGVQDVELANHPFYSKCGNFLTVQWDNHLADLLRYWTGTDAKQVFARTSRMNGQNFVSDNQLIVTADFGEGLTGHILHSELLRSSLGGTRCRIDGDKGSIVFDFNDYLHLQSEIIGGGVIDLDTSGLDFPSSWCGTMGDLLLSIEEDREPLVSGRRNIATMRTIFAEDESARSGGKWISCR